MIAGTLCCVSNPRPDRIPSAREPGSSSTGDSWLDFVLRSVVPGFIATILIGIGALGVGWLPLATALVDTSVVDALRSTTFGVVVAKSAVVVGAALLLQSWLLMGHDVLRGRVTDPRRMWLALGAWSLPLMLTPPLFSRDVYSYFAQGKLVAAGIDPYTHGSSSVPGWFNDGVDPMWAEAPTPYGQFWLILARGVAEFTGPHPYSAALVLRLLAVAGVVLLAWSIPKIAYYCGIDPCKALWLGVLNPLVLMHFVSGAHNDALMVGLVSLGIALALMNLPIFGVIAVALGAGVKPIGLVALPFIGLIWAGAGSTKSRLWLRWVYSGLIAAAVIGIFGVLTKTGVGWLSALSTPGEVKTWLSPPTAVGMAIGGVLELFGLDVTDSIITVTRGIGTLLTLVVLAWLCLRPRGRTPVRGAALAFFTLVALGPVLQPWYLLWSLPLFAAAGMRRIELRIAIVGTAGFSLFGLITSSATQDTLLQISDTWAILFVAVVIAILMAVSPRERDLLLGDSQEDGLQPETPEAIARAEALTTRVVAIGR